MKKARMLLFLGHLEIEIGSEEKILGCVAGTALGSDLSSSLDSQFEKLPSEDFWRSFGDVLEQHWCCGGATRWIPYTRPFSSFLANPALNDEQRFTRKDCYLLEIGRSKMIARGYATEQGRKELERAHPRGVTSDHSQMSTKSPLGRDTTAVTGEDERRRSVVTLNYVD
jgi:hypothetical protein